MMTRRAALFLLVMLSQACTATLVENKVEVDSDRPPWFALEGSELGHELASSPSRKAPVPFLRLGVNWDATSPTALEISTSIDGQTWSAWRSPRVVGHELEGQTEAAFVGDYDLDEDAEDAAQYYRVRGMGGVTYVGLEFLDVPFAASIEDGAEPDGEPDVEAAAAVNSRSAWGARPPKCVSNHTPNRFTIHHTVTPTNDTVSPQARLRNIQAYHQDTRGWCDIGYNFLISRDGRVWEGRGASRVGSHVASQNTGNVGVAFLGTYTTTSASSTQITNVAGLIRSLSTRYGLTPSSTTVKGHRDRGSTSCPGDRLYGQIRTIVSSAQTAVIEEPPAMATTTVKGTVYVGMDPSTRIAGATVTLGDRTVTTGDDGSFAFPDIAEETFTLSASASGYLPVTLERAATGAETWASISLSPALHNASLQGVVYHGQNSAARLPGARITLSTGETATTDASGYYRITGLAPGPVTITATLGSWTSTVQRTLVSNVVTWGSVSL
ncbi:MAG: N-acetylmuramoyl-L-alanine amidase [Kofleriaceae bacterium]